MKKKMKKLFSKLTVLVLLVATLVPYLNIPTVKAVTETECTGEWEYHTNYYFFIQAEHPREWASMLATDSGAFSTNDNTATTYYTSFMYNFPSDGSTLDITSAGFVDLNMDGSTNDINSTSEWSVKGFYNQLLKMNDSENSFDYSNPNSTYKQYSYEATNNDGKTEEKTIISYLIHGPWGFAGLDEELSKADIVLNDKKSIISIDSYEAANNNNNVSESTILKELVNASVVPESNDISNINIGVDRDLLKENKDAINAIKSSIKDFNRDKGKETKSGIYKTSQTGELVLRLYIRRSYDTDTFFEKEVSGLRIQTGGNYMNSILKTQTGDDGVDGLDPTYKLYFPEIDRADDPTSTICDEGRTDCNSYAYVTQGTSSDKVSKPTAIRLEADKKDEYWFLAPSLFQISYKVCKDANTPIVEGDGTKEEVTLSYNANKPEDASGDVTGMPDNQKQEKGTEFTISDKKPELEGYKFKSWNISAKCDDQSYEPKFKLGKLENNTPLYACWGSTDTTEPGKTGVLTYTGLFAGIIALAGGSYYLIKKKNLFRKI